MVVGLGVGFCNIRYCFYVHSLVLFISNAFCYGSTQSATLGAALFQLLCPLAEATAAISGDPWQQLHGDHSQDRGSGRLTHGVSVYSCLCWGVLDDRVGYEVKN